MSKKYTAQDLDALVSEIETQFHTHLTKAEAEASAPLAKAEKEEKCEMAKEEGEDKDKKDDDKKDDDKKPEDKKDEDKKDDDKKEDKELPAFMEKSEYSDADKSELNKLYTEMSKSERETHYAALKASMAAEVKGERPMNKSEDAIKAEKEIETLKKSNEELTKTVGELIATMNKKVKAVAPKGKAVTGLTALDKSEKADAPQMSREEAKKILGKKAQTPDLAKSDRELINAFTFGHVGLDRVQHLLK